MDDSEAIHSLHIANYSKIPLLAQVCFCHRGNSKKLRLLLYRKKIRKISVEIAVEVKTFHETNSDVRADIALKKSSLFSY